MTERLVGTMDAGRHPVWEVLRDDSTGHFIIRHVDPPHREVRIDATAMPTLIRIIQDELGTK